MLKELHNCSIDRGLSACPGFKAKKIAAYISLAADGSFIAIDPPPEERVMCPDLGSAAQGTVCCNILVEKAFIPLGYQEPKGGAKEWKRVGAQSRKCCFYIEALKKGCDSEPMFESILTALETPDTVEKIKNALLSSNIKLKSLVGFKVDGKPVEQSKNYLNWWDSFRETASNRGNTSDSQQRCLITGNLTKPMSTVPKVTGLFHLTSSKDTDNEATLISFDKSSFESYGLKQAANAAVSEEAMSAVNAALNDLIANAPALAGAKWLHWYQSPVETEEDVFSLLLPNFEFDGGEEEDDMTEPSASVDEKTSLAAATRLVESARNGERPERLRNRYYILVLSKEKSRIKLLSWSQGSYEELYENIKAWFDDLQLILPSGKGMCKPPKLFALNIRLLKVIKKSSKEPWERIADELSNLEPRIIQAIINNTALPDTIAVRALQYIRSGMLASSDDDNERKKDPAPDALACQWLKVWLIRKQRAKGGKTTMKDVLFPESTSPAYHAGRMMAVYADIQAKALGPDLGAGVIQRYYAAACTTPALVMGHLSKLCNYHLGKIENKYKKEDYLNLLGEIAQMIGASLPPTLTLEEQAEFALGYYQQRAALMAPRPNTSQHLQTDEEKEEV